MLTLSKSASDHRSTAVSRNRSPWPSVSLGTGQSCSTNHPALAAVAAARYLHQLPVVAIVWLVLVSATSVVLQVPDELGEFCQWETFNASCTDVSSGSAQSHVIVMTSARYGRMRFGRCMREDHGSAGCSADVLVHLDRKCSGRTSCLMTIPDATLHSVHPCPKELMPYLEASYSCLPVKKWNVASCNWYEMAGGDLTRSGGSFIAAVGPEHVLPPGAECPWRITAKPGQHINVSIHLGNVVLTPPSNAAAFAETQPDSDEQDSAGLMSSSSWSAAGIGNGISCGLLAVDVVDGNRTVTLRPPCGGGGERLQRQPARMSYSTVSSHIMIYVRAVLIDTDMEGIDGHHDDISAASDSAENAGFLLQFQAFGCADIPATPGAWVRRTGDTAVVKCNVTGATYFLTCKDSTWKGELHNCTTEGVAGAIRGSFTYTYGILVIIGVGVALGVAFGVVLLFAIVICVRRRKLPHEMRHHYGKSVQSKKKSSRMSLLASTSLYRSSTENPLLARYRSDQTMNRIDSGGCLSCRACSGHVTTACNGGGVAAVGGSSVDYYHRRSWPAGRLNLQSSTTTLGTAVPDDPGLILTDSGTAGCWTPDVDRHLTDDNRELASRQNLTSRHGSTPAAGLFVTSTTNGGCLCPGDVQFQTTNDCCRTGYRTKSVPGAVVDGGSSVDLLRVNGEFRAAGGTQRFGAWPNYVGNAAGAAAVVLENQPPAIRNPVRRCAGCTTCTSSSAAYNSGSVTMPRRRNVDDDVIVVNSTADRLNSTSSLVTATKASGTGAATTDTFKPMNSFGKVMVRDNREQHQVVTNGDDVVKTGICSGSRTGSADLLEQASVLDAASAVTKSRKLQRL